MNYIKIDGYSIVNSNALTPGREDVYAGEYTNANGELIADLIGWKYSDLTLSWDTLPQVQLEKILTTSGAFELTFIDPVEGETTESVIRASAVSTKTRYTNNGHIVWKDVSFSVRFLNVHN